MQKKLCMPDTQLHFPKADTAAYIKSWQSGVRCAVMQGGQGDIKHWAFNDPPKRTGKFKNEPPPPAEYRKLTTRIVSDLVATGTCGLTPVTSSVKHHVAVLQSLAQTLGVGVCPIT